MGGTSNSGCLIRSAPDTSNNDRGQGEGGINAIESGAIEYLGDRDEGDVTSGVT